MSIDQISSGKKFVRRLGLRLALLAVLVATPWLAEAQLPPPLYTPAPTFSATNHYVAASVFQWFTSNGGQLTGPWRPIEGRSNWTGTPDFWQGQIKQMMAANIDVLYVHLIPSSEAQRTNLFIALNQLRAEGYDTPKIAPFLDPMITWDQMPLVNLATTAGKDEFVGQYLRFYNQYFGVSTGAYADDYLARQADKPVLDTWHVQFNCSNLNSLTRADVSNRLGAALGAAHPYFTNGFVMVTTALNPPTLSFADEKVPQFEINQYYYPFTYNSIRSVQLKGGYWDQNIRNPGSFLARAGGVNYSNAWYLVDRLAVRRVYLESWNEYDEGTGIYAGTNLPPYIAPANNSGNPDVWSTTGDPFEYIKTTARGAASFNDTPAQNAKILWHNLPSSLGTNEARTVSMVVRNTGDASWTAGQNYKLGQTDADTTAFVTGKRLLLNDRQDEIPIYGGIFRGRPKTFTFTLRAPPTNGVFTTHWRLIQEGAAWFGEELTVTITVGGPAQTQSIPNGGFETNSIGTTVVIGDPGTVDTTTFADWRMFSVGAPPINLFRGTIVDASDYGAGGTPGNQAIRLDVDNTGAPAGYDYGLDRHNAKVPVAYGTSYVLSFDAVLYGVTGKNFSFAVGLSEYADSAEAFTGSQTTFSPTLSSDALFHHYTFSWTPLNTNMTHVNIAFRPRNPGSLNAVGLDNVGFTAVATGGAQQLPGLYPGITVTGDVGTHYRVEYATGLAPTTWLLLQDIPQLPVSPFKVYDPAVATQPKRFYRAVLVP